MSLRFRLEAIDMRLPPARQREPHIPLAVLAFDGVEIEPLA